MSKRTLLEGCCRASWFYDLGGAHGVDSADSFEEFAKNMHDQGCNEVNLAITVKFQSDEEGYLRKMGWRCIKKVTGDEFDEDDLKVWYISGEDFENALKKINDDLKKKNEEKAKKNRETEEKAQRLKLSDEPKRVKIPYYPTLQGIKDIYSVLSLKEVVKTIYDVDTNAADYDIDQAREDIKQHILKKR